jgi:hypothetical protein
MMARRRRKPATPLPLPTGDDGWTRWPSDSNEAYERRRMEYETAFLRAREGDVMKDGYFPALMGALAFCRERKLPLPCWLHEIIWANLDHAYHANSKLRKRCEAETERRKKHLERYDMVQELLERRDEARDPNQRFDLLVTLDNVFEIASEYVKAKKPANKPIKVTATKKKPKEPDTADAIRASYFKIKREGVPYVAQYRATGGVIKPRKKRKKQH